MTELWHLPDRLTVGGKSYPIHGDFRDVLEIFSYLRDPALPEFMRWEVALRLFFEGQIPTSHKGEAMQVLCRFLTCGQEEKPGPSLMDWDQDAAMIVADVNRVAGQEIRQLPFVHWWTFLSWFHAIGQGQLSTVVAIRDKLRRGKKLESWEQDFYRENKDRVELKKRYSAQELQEQDRLKRLLEQQKGREEDGE